MKGRTLGSKNGGKVDIKCTHCGIVSSVVHSRRTQKFCDQICLSAFRSATRPSKEQKRAKQRENAARWRANHPERAKALFADYRAKNAEHCKRRTKIWRTNNREAYLTGKRRCRLGRDFGITLEQYNEMLAAQGGVCAICKNPETHQRKGVWSLSVDHCHDTGRVRGLLCNNCNRGVGLLRDNADLCRAAAEYLCK